MSSSIHSHAHENGVVHPAPADASDRNARLIRAAYAGASAGLRTFTVAATALRVKDNAWAPLFGGLARAEIIYDKLPETPTRLRPAGLAFRAISAAAAGAALATRKDPAWLPLSAAAVVAALATAYIGGTFRTKVANPNVPDWILGSIEDQIAIHWAARAYPEPEPINDPAPAIKTVSLL